LAASSCTACPFAALFPGAAMPHMATLASQSQSQSQSQSPVLSPFDATGASLPDGQYANCFTFALLTGAPSLPPMTLYWTLGTEAGQKYIDMKVTGRTRGWIGVGFAPTVPLLFFPCILLSNIAH